jgi:hypothetical protein
LLAHLEIIDVIFLMKGIPYAILIVYPRLLFGKISSHSEK